MNTRTLLTCLILSLSATDQAAAKTLLAVQGSSPGLRRTLNELDLRVYGLTGTYTLVDGARAAADRLAARGLTFTTVSPDAEAPLFVVYLPTPQARARVKAMVPALLDDGDAMLAQMDDATASMASQAGAELVRLPEQPFPVFLPAGTELPRATLTDTFVQRRCASVSTDSIRRQMKRLQDFQTRYSPTDSCRSSEQYVFDYFASLGLDSVAFFPYEFQPGDTWRNVLGIRWGRVSRDRYVIVCGHMDSESEDHWNLAPGAEDNASGTVMALEAARVLARDTLDVTLVYIAFTGEEQGLVGSFYFASWMRSLNADIIAALNFDMISWPGGSFGVAIHGDTLSRSLGEYEARMASLYTTLATRVDNQQYGSDHLAFEYFGYPSTAGAEYGSYYPYYHTTADTIGYCSMPLAAEVCRMSVATAASLAASPAAPPNFRLQDAGLGGALHASWSPSPSPDVAGYKLVWGTQPRTYTDSVLLGVVLSHDITGLVNGTRYYATVMAIDSGGREGFPAVEQNGVPGLEPLPPAGFAAWPFRYGMALAWRPNLELDLAGYNVYRSTVPGGNYVRLNQSPATDTVYRDSGLVSDTMYYYVVTAVDTSRNESGQSVEVRGKPITLDHGILLVDETRDGSGQPGNPSDAQQDAFYHSALRGSRYTDWDCTTQDVPLAGDIGPYSTIVWHADDYSQMLASDAVPGLANYLSHGGRLWYVGWRPIQGLMGGVAHYPYHFAPGQFPYDWLHLADASLAANPDFIGATGQAGYPSLSTDSTKMVAATHGRLPFVDALYPRDAEVVLTYNSFSGDTFQGKPVGVRWLTSPGKVVFFGFPLYFTKDDEARSAALKVLDDLGEPYAIAEGRPTPDAGRFTLEVGPNPARVLRIGYSLPNASLVRLALYDIAGKQVAWLAQGVQPAGRHTVRFDARGLSAGTYICRMESPGFSATRKLILQR